MDKFQFRSEEHFKEVLANCGILVSDHGIALAKQNDYIAKSAREKMNELYTQFDDEASSMPKDKMTELVCKMHDVILGLDAEIAILKTKQQ